MQTGELIKKLRVEKGLTQEQLGNLLGIQKSAVAKYENGRVENIKRMTIKKMSEIFDVSPLVFLENEYEDVRKTSTITVPIYSNLSCGKGLLTEERPIDHIALPPSMMFSGKAFGNIAQGDSMEPTINSGDLIIFQETPEVESGQIGSFSLNGECYCKRFRKLADGSCWLFSDNPKYEPIPIKSGDDFRTLGVYKLKISKEQ